MMGSRCVAWCCAVVVALVVLATPHAARAQAGSVTGIVRSESRTVPFVRVDAILSDAVRSVGFSDEDGRYSLTLPEGQYSLVFTMFGYADLLIEGVVVRPGASTTRRS